MKPDSALSRGSNARKDLNGREKQLEARRVRTGEKIKLIEQYLRDYPSGQHNVAAKKKHDRLLIEKVAKAGKQPKFWNLFVKKE